MHMIKRYKKKLEKLFTGEELHRKQLNFTCDIQLITRLKLLSVYLNTPLYPLLEHVIELGINDIASMTISPSTFLV